MPVTGPPPAALVRGLLAGPDGIAAVEWHPVVDSTNAVAAAAAARGAPEIGVVVADAQTAGRGRHGRRWQSPPGASLLLSLLVRPVVPPAAVSLLPLLTGLALAETVDRCGPALPVALKWPNDLLLGSRKAAGILVEGLPGGAAVVGIGVNVDWRGVERGAELAGATSLAEAGAAVDRWALLADLVSGFARRYRAWQALPAAFLDGYRARCTTLGRPVMVTRRAGDTVTGVATAVRVDGALIVRVDDGGTVAVTAGDVEHLRPA